MVLIITGTAVCFFKINTVYVYIIRLCIYMNIRWSCSDTVYGNSRPSLTLVVLDQVKNKIDMVDNLLEIELAYNLLSEGDKSDKVGTGTSFERKQLIC